MNGMPHIARFALHLRLQAMRLGWFNLLTLLILLAACASCFWLVPQLRMRDANSLLELEKAKRSLTAAPPVSSAPAVAPIDKHAKDFYETLGDSRYAEQQVKTLFAVATKNGLTLSQAEYKYAANQNGMFHTYSISLPVKGQYASIRAFCEQVLLAIPFASLDQIEFKRDSINNPGLEAKIKLTLYLNQSADAAKDGES